MKISHKPNIRILRILKWSNLDKNNYASFFTQLAIIRNQRKINNEERRWPSKSLSHSSIRPLLFFFSISISTNSKEILMYKFVYKLEYSKTPFIATPVYCNLSLPFIAINSTIFFPPISRRRGHVNAKNARKTIRWGACADNQLVRLVLEEWQPLRICDKREAFNW